MYCGCVELDVRTAGLLAHTGLCPLLVREGGVLLSGSCAHPLPLFVAPNIKTVWLLKKKKKKGSSFVKGLVASLSVVGAEEVRALKHSPRELASRSRCGQTGLQDEPFRVVQ